MPDEGSAYICGHFMQEAFMMIAEKHFCLLHCLNWQRIAGETMPDEGSAYICEHSMQREMAKARQLVGYCPQFDALAGTLTGTQEFLLCPAPTLTFLLAL